VRRRPRAARPMPAALSCWKCGEPLAVLSLPLTRLDECPKCRAQLHVCRMCERFAPRLPKGCSEEDSPDVRDKKSANFCDYFKPSAKAYDPATQQAEQAAKSALDALFKN
jgi:hypothetical protein